MKTMKTKKKLFLMCCILGIFFFLSSCDKKKESCIFADDSIYCTDMKMYLIEHDEKVVKIYTANYETLSYDSLTTFARPKYAEINNQQIIYILNNPKEISTEKQIHTSYWFEGIFLHYEKRKINYTISLVDGDFHQNVEILMNKSGVVWSWIIGFGLLILGLIVYCIRHCIMLIKKKKDFDNVNFLLPFSFITPVITIVVICIENFLEDGLIVFAISVAIVFYFAIQLFWLVTIDTWINNIRIYLINRDVKKLMKKNKYL
jgi:uncharacterized lipoprotein YehR (DUF1307 family)